MIGIGRIEDGLYHLQQSKYHCNDQSSPLPQQLTSVSDVSRTNSILHCNVSASIICNSTSNITAQNSIDLWHCRLGHVPISKLSVLHKNVPAITFNKNLHCSNCPLAKQHKLPFPTSEIKSSNSFDLIHWDVWGPYSIPSLDGSKYFLTIVDDFSRIT